MKPANTLVITLQNPSNIGLGRYKLFLRRDINFHHHTSISSDEWPASLAETYLDTIPPGFSKTFTFPSVPEETVFIQLLGKKIIKPDTVFTLRGDTMRYTYIPKL